MPEQVTPQQELQRVFRAIAGAFDPKEPPPDRYMHRLETALKKATDDQTRAVTYYKMALATTYTDSDVAAEETAFNQALTSAKAAGYRKGEAAALAALAMRAECRGDLDKARSMLGDAMKVHEALDLKPEIAVDYVNLGMIEGNNGNLQKGTEQLEKGLSLAKEANHDLGIAAAQANLCAAQALSKDLKSAKQSYDALQAHRALAVPYFLYYREWVATPDMPPMPDDSVSQDGLAVVKAKPGERIFNQRALIRYREVKEDPVVPCVFLETPYFLP